MSVKFTGWDTLPFLEHRAEQCESFLFHCLVVRLARTIRAKCGCYFLEPFRGIFP